VPRDVDAAMNELDGVFVYDIDDLQQVVASHLGDRKREAERAEALVEVEVEKFQSRLQTLDVVPTIVSLQEQMDTIRQAEIDRFRGRLGPLNAEQEAAVEAMTRGIINKILHTPIRTLKSAAKDPESATVVDVVKQIFNLSAKEAAASASVTKPSDPNAPKPELQEERLK
jgi:glutamyl-tRNA reductase